jgi:hypothetical protein
MSLDIIALAVGSIIGAYFLAFFIDTMKAIGFER